MKTPPLLLGAAILFWGWQTGFLAWAAPMAVVVEGRRVTGVRWELAPRHFHRLADLCALIFLALGVYRFTAGGASLARWIPLAFFPLMAAQAYGTAGGVDLGAISYTARQKEKQGPDRPRRTVDIAYPYFALTLLAASAANRRTPLFFAGLVVLSAWALWPLRPRRAPLLFAFLFLLAAAAGLAGGHGLNRLQIWLETGVVDWYSGLDDRRNPLRSVTAIGEIGRLKQSDRIVLRVYPRASFKAGLLLHEASYNRYNGRVWVASRARFTPVAPLPGDPPGGWRLPAPPHDGDDAWQADIVLQLPEGGGVLSLPHGCRRIAPLPGTRLETNGYGAFRAVRRPGWVRYRVTGLEGGAAQKPPSPSDLRVPPQEARAVRALLERMPPTADTPSALAAALKEHFAGRFHYSLEQGRPTGGRTPLAHFLEVSRSGHCEFFATATVLALRAAGVPARYATGYSAGEYSRLEGCLIARSRHAHAWALAYIDGRWQPVDTTPSGWLTTEADRASWLAPALDAFRYAAFRLARWRREWDGRMPGGWIWAAVPLLGMALWFGWRRRVRATAERRSKGGASPAPAGPPSPFDAVAARLAASGYPRRAGETPAEWVERMGRSGLPPAATERLRRVVRWHYRLRFRPGGLENAARRRMEDECRRLVSEKLAL